MRQKLWVVNIVSLICMFDVKCFYVIVFQFFSRFKKFLTSYFMLFKLIGKILTTKPGGEHIIQEYAKTKSLTDATRRQMINILAAEMTEAHG